MTALALLAMFLVQGCDQRVKWQGKIWNGGVNEITRNVEVDGQVMEEFLPTDSPSFKNFRCVTKRDMNELIEIAMRQCKK